MIEIARNYKIEYEPDPTMFLVGWNREELSLHNNMYRYLQDDDGYPAAELDEPFHPDGSSAGPLPRKQEPPDSTRYQPFPPSSGPPTQSPPSNQPVSPNS